MCGSSNGQLIEDVTDLINDLAVRRAQRHRCGSGLSAFVICPAKTEQRGAGAPSCHPVPRCVEGHADPDDATCQQGPEIGDGGRTNAAHPASAEWRHGGWPRWAVTIRWRAHVAVQSGGDRDIHAAEYQPFGPRCGVRSQVMPLDESVTAVVRTGGAMMALMI